MFAALQTLDEVVTHVKQPQIGHILQTLHVPQLVVTYVEFCQVLQRYQIFDLRNAIVAEVDSGYLFLAWT